MNLSFKDEALRKICLTKARAVAILGPKTAYELRKRIADIKASDNAGDLLIGVSIENLESMEVICIRLADDYVMKLRANHVDNPTSASGKIIWAEVSRMMILEIVRSAAP